MQVLTLALSKEYRHIQEDKQMPKTTAEFQLPGLKWCAACKRHLPVEEFWKNCRTKDGRTSSCKSCTARMDANWRAKSVEKIKAYKATKKFLYLARANN